MTDTTSTADAAGSTDAADAGIVPSITTTAAAVKAAMAASIGSAARSRRESRASGDAPDANEMRMRRDALLAQSDWMVSRAADGGTPVPDEWKTYRQALRDITTQPGFPDGVVWPTQPEATSDTVTS